MRFRSLVWLFALFVFAPPGLARAQDFGVMESAETINRGNFKIRVNPMLIFGRGGGDETFGVGALVGYGFTDKFDLEGGVALYDGVTFFGGSAEFWIVKAHPIDFSVIVGLHARRGDRTADATGVDLTFLVSGHATPRLELYGALDFAFEKFDDNGRFKTIHLVPGIEYKLGEDLDLLAEVGIALNDNARHYISGGIAYYIR